MCSISSFKFIYIFEAGKMAGGKKSEEDEKKRKRNYRPKGAAKRAKRDKEKQEQNKSVKQGSNPSKNKKEQSRLVYEAHMLNCSINYILYSLWHN